MLKCSKLHFNIIANLYVSQFLFTNLRYNWIEIDFEKRPEILFLIMHFVIQGNLLKFKIIVEGKIEKLLWT